MIYTNLYPNQKKQCNSYQQLPLPEFEHHSFATKAIHCSQADKIHGSINIPIHLSSTFAQHDMGSFYSQFYYSRIGNPTRSAFQKNIASLEYGQFAVAFSSGCGAITAIISLLKTGEHMLICDDVYQNTYRDIAETNYHIQIEYVDMTNPENIRSKIRSNTKLIWTESPSNPTLKILDLQKICKIAAQHQILSVCDNTFCSPYLQNPLLLGTDIVFHSCTKYIDGHSDIVMGVLVTNKKQLHTQLHEHAYKIGACPGPFDCYFALRGLKTLQVRMKQICKNAYNIAHYLQDHPVIVKVLYPGLKSHPQHEVALKQMRSFGGMITIAIKGGRQQASKFLKSLKIFCLAVSLGGVQSLAQCPALMTHKSLKTSHQQGLGITLNLIRLSIGIQNLEDLIEDLDQALAKSQL